MYCRKCGAQNDENAYRCLQCGDTLQHPVAASPPREIPNYLVQSILVTVFCCLPFGIPAIVYAAQVNGKIAAGDIQGAINASNTAKMWVWLSFGFGLAWVVLYIGFVVLGALAHA
jgi:hypothetical protein